MLEKYKDAQNKFEGKEVPLPPNWGGFLVEPNEYEFFLYGEHRLNDRFLYNFNNDVWTISRLEP